MCTTISGNSYIGKILEKEFNGKSQITSADLYTLDKDNDGKPDLDANQDGKISTEELRDFLKKEGIDKRFTNAEIKIVAQEAQTLTALIQKGGTLTKHDSEANVVSFDLKLNQTETSPKLSDVKSEGNINGQFNFKIGQSGPDIKKLHTLLNNLYADDPNFKPFTSKDDTFDERTAALIADFQKSGNPPLEGQPGITSGVVDRNTLIQLEKAAEISLKDNNIYSGHSERRVNTNKTTKPVTPVKNNGENLAPVGNVTGSTNPVSPQPQSNNTQSGSQTQAPENGNQTQVPGNETTQTGETNTGGNSGIVRLPPPPGISPEKLKRQNEVREKVINQLRTNYHMSDEQINQAFGLSRDMMDSNLGVINESQARTKRISNGLCYTGFKEGMERSLHIKYPYLGNAAKTADTAIFEGKYKDNFVKLDLTRDDLMNLPPEFSVINVYEGGEYGHISNRGQIDDKGTNADVSDKVRVNANPYPNSQVHTYLAVKAMQPGDADYISPQDARRANNLEIGVRGGGGKSTRIR